MKFKTLSRIVGTFDAAAWSYVGYLNYRTLNELDFNKVGDFFNSYYPPEYKVAVGTVIGMQALAIPVTLTGIADGFSDIVTGAHHYLGLVLWKKFTRDAARKTKIQSEIDEMFALREQKLKTRLS